MTYDTIKIADSIRYGRYQHMKAQAIEVAKLIERAMPHARKIMQLPDGLNFIVRPLGGKYNGGYNFRFKQVGIDPRRSNIGTILSTLMHELVHAEQYHTGRLTQTNLRTQLWNGEAVTNKGTTYDAYRKLPWEVEAFDRQDKLAKQITDMIAAETE